MLSFCICDDDESLCAELKDMLIQYSFLTNIDFTITELHDTESLLLSDVEYDVLFLDICFHGNDIGIDVARELRAKGNNAFIIFLSTMSAYLPDGYEAQAFRFLLKPIQKEKLHEALNAVYKQLEATDRFHARFAVKIGSELVVVHLSDILAVEAASITRHRRILTRDGELITKESLSSLYERLPNNFFAYVHRRYIVNLSHVKRISRTDIILTNNIRVPLGRTHVEHFTSLFNKISDLVI